MTEREKEKLAAAKALTVNAFHCFSLSDAKAIVQSLYDLGFKIVKE
jgi:hypothetical protein